MNNENNKVNDGYDDVAFTGEQEGQTISVRESVRALLMVLLNGKAGYDDGTHIGNVIDVVSDYLQKQGCEVYYPSRNTEAGGSSYIEETQAICRDCDCETSDVLDGSKARYMINQGFADQFAMCFTCHCMATDRGEYTNCDSCGTYFTCNHLLPNKDNEENGEKVREICPYCGEIWCD